MSLYTILNARYRQLNMKYAMHCIIYINITVIASEQVNVLCNLPWNSNEYSTSCRDRIHTYIHILYFTSDFKVAHKVLVSPKEEKIKIKKLIQNACTYGIISNSYKDYLQTFLMFLLNIGNVSDCLRMI
jgi:hypothetical protein